MFDAPKFPSHEDEDLELDYVFDGAVRTPGERGPVRERPAVRNLRALILAVEQGQRPTEDLVNELGRLHGALQTAVRQSAKGARIKPYRADHFLHCKAAYERGLDSLEVMYKAVSRDDSQLLWRGMAGLEGAVVDIDQLTQEEAELPPEKF